MSGIEKTFIGFIVFLIIYPFLFPIYINIIKIFCNKNKYSPNEKINKIVILIPCYNEGNLIYSKLKNLINIEYADFSIVVVNDCSTDNTLSEIKRFLTDFPERITLIDNIERTGKSGILNKFIPQMESDYVFVMDANMFVEKNVLSILNSHLNENIGIVYGNLSLEKSEYSSITDEEILYWRFETYLKKIQQKCGNITSPVGGFYILNRKVFEDIPEKCLTEDMFLLINSLKKGFGVDFSEHAVAVEETTQSTLNEFYRKKRILQGDYYLIDYLFLRFNIFRLKFKDAVALFLNKVLRWLYPLNFLFTVLLSFASIDFLPSCIFLLMNISIISLIMLEFFTNTILNYIYSLQRVRVRIFKKPLYFYTVVIAGICAIFSRNEKLWKKEER